MCEAKSERLACATEALGTRRDGVTVPVGFTGHAISHEGLAGVLRNGHAP